MDASDLKARAVAWSRYWRSGARHSCPDSFTDHYGSATQAFWHERFVRAAPDARALEIGCGNGSLIRWLAQSAAPFPQRMDAVDLADLDARWLDALPPGLRERVSLHPRTTATCLPLDAGAITLICSQYALEYFADEACWMEFERVLAPRATLAAIVHHRDSHLCRVARIEASDSQWLLAVDGPLDRAERMLPWLAMSAGEEGRVRREADPLAAQARQRFNASFTVVEERIAESPFPDLLRDTAEHTMRILQAVPDSGLSAARQSLRVLRATLEDNRLRVAELVDCALDRERVAAWTARLQRMGFATVSLDEIVEQGYLFGWSLVASRERKE